MNFLMIGLGAFIGANLRHAAADALSTLMLQLAASSSLEANGLGVFKTG